MSKDSDKDFQWVLLDEIRENRSEIKKIQEKMTAVNEKVNGLKVRVYMMAVVLGGLGHEVKVKITELFK